MNYTSNYIDDNDTPNFNNLNLNLEYNQEYSVTFYDYDSLTDDDNLELLRLLLRQPVSLQLAVEEAMQLLL